MSIQKLYIDQQVAESTDVHSISKRLNLKGEIVKKAQEVYDRISAAADPVKKGKEINHQLPTFPRYAGCLL